MFMWTGIRIDKNGKSKKTGFEWLISRALNLRVTTFPVPSKNFDKSGRRLVVEAGRLHAMFTWRPSVDNSRSTE